MNLLLKGLKLAWSAAKRRAAYIGFGFRIRDDFTSLIGAVDGHAAIAGREKFGIGRARTRRIEPTANRGAGTAIGGRYAIAAQALGRAAEMSPRSAAARASGLVYSRIG